MFKAIESYKTDVTFGLVFIVCMCCVVLIGAQWALMNALQSEETIWQGVCKGGELSNGGEKRTNMIVHCPGEEEFTINNPDVIATSNNEGKVFFCRQTKGTIMKDEDWSCNVSKGEE